MKTKSGQMKKALSITLLILTSCLDPTPQKPESPYTLTMYEAPPNTQVDQVILQSRLTDRLTGQEVIYFGTYKSSSGIMVPDKIMTLLSRTSAKSDTATVQAFTEEGGIITYLINTKTNVRSNVINEYEPIDANSFYFRIWDYNWSSKQGNCKLVSKVSKNGADFTAVRIPINSGGRVAEQSVSEKIGKLKRTLRNPGFDPTLGYVTVSPNGRAVMAKDFVNDAYDGFANFVTKYGYQIGASTVIIGVVTADPVLVTAGFAFIRSAEIGMAQARNMSTNFDQSKFANTTFKTTTNQTLDGEIDDVAEYYDEADVDADTKQISQFPTASCGISISTTFDAAKNFRTWYASGGAPPYFWECYINDALVSSGPGFVYTCKNGDVIKVFASDTKNCNGSGIAVCP